MFRYRRPPLRQYSQICRYHQQPARAGRGDNINNLKRGLRPGDSSACCSCRRDALGEHRRVAKVASQQAPAIPKRGAVSIVLSLGFGLTRLPLPPPPLLPSNIFMGKDPEETPFHSQCTARSELNRF